MHNADDDRQNGLARAKKYICGVMISLESLGVEDRVGRKKIRGNRKAGVHKSQALAK